MRERNVQIVQLVRAFEETDVEGVLVSMQARDAATRRALRVTGLGDYRGDVLQASHVQDGEVIMRRSRLLFDSIARKLPVLRGMLHVGRLGASTLPAVLVLSLIAGLATNVLGPTGRVNLLSFPLLGILGWNLLAYLGLALTTVLGPRTRMAGEGFAGLLSGLAMRAAIWRRQQSWKLMEGREGGKRRIAARALVRFGALWNRCASALLRTRIRRMFHAAAIALATGAIGGMYLRGIALEYRATWESTWLDAAGVQTIVDLVLGPAAAILSMSVPDVAPLHDQPGPAGPWIHLYAVTVGLVVVLPRSLLFLIESLRGARLAAAIDLDLDDPYFRRLLRDWRGATKRVDIYPYSHAPQPAVLESLKSRLRDRFGARADIRVHAGLEYGDEPDVLVERPGRAGPWRPPGRLDEELADERVENCCVLLFNIAQSPEHEVHGAFLEELRDRVAERGGRLLVLVDAGDYEQRVGSAQRRRERMRAWEELARQSGVPLAELDDGVNEDQMVRRIGAALWPPRSADVTGSAG